MAEFQEVMRQAGRLCVTESCGTCMLDDYCENSMCELLENKVAFDRFEKIVMEWASEHPEPVYPTWKEWHNESFPDALFEIRPCDFMNCKNDCRPGCENQPIPADIAEKLGIKPKVNK